MEKTYSEKLKDPRWQKKRLKIMERDEFMCRSCYDTENTLNVHHKYYIQGRKPWEYPEDLLVTLCEGCHAWEEENKTIVNDFARVLLSDGYLASELVKLLALLRKLPVGDIGLSFIYDAVKEYDKIDWSCQKDSQTQISGEKNL